MAVDYRSRVPHVSAEKALALYRTGRMVLIDVHPAPGKQRSKIIGAIYIPANLIDKIRLNLPRGKIGGIFCK